MNDIYARTAEARWPCAPGARIVEIGIAAPPGPLPGVAAFEAFAVPRLQREAR
ncbi:MAG: hypothetical protein ACLUE1_03190 [Adlercreutzia equolifaciens]